MDLENKKIAVLGIGREGLALAEYFNANEISADFFDENENADARNIEKLNFKTTCGPAAFTNIDTYDVIFRSPGIKREHPKLKDAQNKLTSLTKLFIELWPGKTIGVTGTKGKGTTASIIKSILNAGNIDSVLVGNIGNVNLINIKNFDSDAVAVLELSSFQLHGLGVSPNIAVVLDVGIEHMDYHKDLAEYQQAKLEIVKWQKNNDWAVVTSDNPIVEEIDSEIKSNIVYVGAEKEKSVWWQGQTLYSNLSGEKMEILHQDKIKLFGRHNLINVAAAVAAAQIAGVNKSTVVHGVEGFKGLSQRLEPVAKIGGVTYINDSASTNPAATVAAIRAMDEATILIMGGRNKGLDYAEINQVLKKQNNIKIIIIFGEIKDELYKLLNGDNSTEIIKTDDLKTAVKLAKNNLKGIKYILFSPGAASFDQFENYNVRGQKFNKIIYEQRIK